MNAVPPARTPRQSTQLLLLKHRVGRGQKKPKKEEEEGEEEEEEEEGEEEASK